MSWLCTTCSSTNEDHACECFVCGAAKPEGKKSAGSAFRAPREAGVRNGSRRVVRPAVKEQPRTSKIVFSHLRMTVESVKEDTRNTIRFFKRLFGGVS